MRTRKLLRWLLLVLIVAGISLGVWLAYGERSTLESGTDFSWDSSSDLPAGTDSSGQAQMKRTSFYLSMPDGVKLATDLYLPGALARDERIPAVLWQTRYYRGFDLRWPVSRFIQAPPAVRPEFLVKNGYAFVAVETRGSGASFGYHVTDFSAKEVADGADVVNWIIAQPWSNGKVGAFGEAYQGGMAQLLLTNRHPALKAVAALASPYDLYADATFPGGIFWKSFLAEWTHTNETLDRNDAGRLVGWFQRLGLKGVRPVDSDGHGDMLRTAVREHAKSTPMFDEL